MNKLKFLSLIFYISILGGAIGLFAKIGLMAFSPLTLIFIRIILSLIVFIAVFAWQKRLGKTLKLIKDNWLKFIVLSLSCVGAAMVIGFIGLRYTTAINYGLIYNLSPIFMIIFSVALLKEKITRRDIFFIFLAFLGATFIITNGEFKINISESHFFGDFLVLISACGWALYSILGTKFSKEKPELDPLSINFGSFLIAAVFLAPFVFTAPHWGINAQAINIKIVSSVIGLSIFSTAILFFLWLKFIKEKGGTWASLVTFSENLSGVILPIIFLGERMTWPIFMGGILMIMALYGKDLMGKISKKSPIRHNNFFVFKARNNFKLGLMMGKKFGEFARQTINTNIKESDWTIKKEKAKKYLEITKKYFPQYAEELRGYAQGAKIDFLDLWTISLEDETIQVANDKCTTIITNNGKLIAHNEDWSKNSEDNICIVSKTIKNTTILELYYFNTLGGNSISINSHGFITAVNTLTHGNQEFGIPRNVIARWLSETKNPTEDFIKLQTLPKSLGFSVNFINQEGKIWNIEYNSQETALTQPPSPYVHTNHYLSQLKSSEINDNSTSTFDRYETANSKVKTSMIISELINLTNDQSQGNVLSIMNERTIAKMIIDLENLTAKVWLRREKEKEWINYDLKNIWKK